MSLPHAISISEFHCFPGCAGELTCERNWISLNLSSTGCVGPRNRYSSFFGAFFRSSNTLTVSPTLMKGLLCRRASDFSFLLCLSLFSLRTVLVMIRRCLINDGKNFAGSFLTFSLDLNLFLSMTLKQSVFLFWRGAAESCAPWCVTTTVVRNPEAQELRYRVVL